MLIVRKINMGDLITLDNAEETKAKINILFLDLSSQCCGYAVVSADFESKNATFKSAGAFWLKDSWDTQEKYMYISSALQEYFNIIHKIDYCVCESYRINTKRLMGAQTSIELHGAVALSLAMIGVKYDKIEVSTWRKQLNIRPIITEDKNGKKTRDYKTPTKDVVSKYLTLPDKIYSNSSGQMRDLPSDLTDAIAQGMGFLKTFNFRHFDFSNTKIQEHKGQVQI
jgi:Holliday junction resolvasome RuvABC endonuclease subunit